MSCFFLDEFVSTLLEFWLCKQKKTSIHRLGKLLFSILVQLMDLKSGYLPEAVIIMEYLTENNEWVSTMWTINCVVEKILLRRHLIVLSIPDFNFVLQWKVFLQLLIWALLIPAVSLPSLFPVSSFLPHRIFLFSFKRKLTKYNLTFPFFSSLLPTHPPNSLFSPLS